MIESLEVVPSDDAVKAGVRDPAPVAGALAGVLADTDRLTFKTHGYHGNVEGSLFCSVHNLTEEQYEDVFETADEPAERIRALGRVMNSSVVVDPEGTPSAGGVVADLVAGEDQNDDVTADLPIARSAFHQKAAWMLRAIAAA